MAADTGPGPCLRSGLAERGSTVTFDSKHGGFVL